MVLRITACRLGSKPDGAWNLRPRRIEQRPTKLIIFSRGSCKNRQNSAVSSKPTFQIQKMAWLHAISVGLRVPRRRWLEVLLLLFEGKSPLPPLKSRYGAPNGGRPPPLGRRHRESARKRRTNSAENCNYEKI